MEPFLHGVPIVWGFIFAITKLAEKNDNDTGSGNCVYPVYDPPHCIGYDVGEVREGFDIPCGRGRDGAVLFVYVAFFVTFCVVPPIIIGMSFGMIYRAAKQQEQANLRYGVAAFTNSQPMLIPNILQVVPMTMRMKRSIISLGWIDVRAPSDQQCLLSIADDPLQPPTVVLCCTGRLHSPYHIS